MKEVYIYMSKVLILILSFLLIPITSFAQNNRLPLYACESLSSTDVSCGETIGKDASVANNHSWIQRECLSAVTSGFVCHFYWPPLMPSSGNVTVTWEQRGNNGNDACIETTLGCATNGTDIIYTTPTEDSVTMLASNYGQYPLTVAVPSSPTDHFCAVRYRRLIGTACTDTASNKVEVRGGFISW